MHALLLLLSLATQSASPSVDFVRDIRPILSDRCFQCHGPGDTAEVGGFRLDRRADALADLGGYAAIVPGHPEQSELLERVRHKKARMRMPPPESKLELSGIEILLLEQWIAEGAAYTDHWAFTAPKRSVPPAPRTDDGLASWPRDDLDNFVLARMAAGKRQNAGRSGFDLKPAQETDRATWLRRASYDLTGLPPTLADLDAFLAAEDEQAYEREANRLLASPRHAERMATIWLDAARYADTYGYQSDVYRDVWPWRDWVIDSYARNQPYDEFLTWQIAGDLLPNATRESRLATTFNRLHRQTNEGGSTEEEYRVEYVADRVQTLSTAVMGLTMECARCHDHKFDPISQKEFYGFFAFFDGVDESGLYAHFTNAVPTPALDLPTDAQEAQLATLEAAIADAQAVLGRAWAEPVEAATSIAVARDMQGRFACDALEGDKLANDVAPAEGEEARFGQLKGGQKLVAGFSGEALEFTGDDPAVFPGIGHFHRSDPFTIGLRLWLPKTYERAVVLHRSRAWTDSASRGYELLIEEGRASAALIHFWPGDAVRVRSREALPLEQWLQITLTWDGSSRAAGLKLYLDGLPIEVEVVRDNLRRTILGGGLKNLTLGERFRDKGLAGGRIDDLFVAGREMSAAEVQHLALGKDAAEPSVAALIEHTRRANDGGQRDALEALRAARRARDDKRDSVRQIMTMAAMPYERKAHVLARGSYLERGEEVQPHTPAMLPPFPRGAPLNRLGLAQWLMDPDHPLTARVEVNRLWQVAFGRGLIGTPEDLGSQGDPPSHPQLLDTLAVDLIESGWDRRALLKRFVLSATYRQESRESTAARGSDPDNRLLSHAQRRRLSAEMLRDGALFAAGLLVEKRGGPPVKPYQPAGLWKEKSGKVYKADSGEGLWRRSLYTIWKRTSPPPAMMILDAAKRDVCVVQRQSTSSPLQALLLWNDPQYVEAARMLAERTLREGGTSRVERAGFAFRTLTSRVATEEELAILLSLQEEQRAAFAAQPEAANALLTVGEAPLDQALDPVNLASWTVVAQALLSFDATISTP